MNHDDNNIKIAVLQTQMNNIENKVDEGFADIKKLIQEQSDRLDKRLGDKANKWVEKAMIWIGALVGAAIVTAIMSRILIK